MLCDAVSGLIKQLVPDHLPLVLEIYYYFATYHKSPSADLMAPDHMQACKDFLYSELLRVYTPGTGKRLLDSMREGSPYGLLQICYGLDRLRANDYAGLPFDGWAGFAAVLSEAMQEDPERALPYIVPFVTSFESEPRGVQPPATKEDYASSEPARFERERAKRLFESDYSTLLAVFAQRDVPPGLSIEMRLRFEAVCVAARNELNSDPPSLDD